MAFVRKSGKRYQVRKGDTGELLNSFSGKGAKKRAEMTVFKLHKEHNPKQSNRGKVAAKRH